MEAGGLGPWFRGLRFWEGNHRIPPEGKTTASGSRASGSVDGPAGPWLLPSSSSQPSLEQPLVAPEPGGNSSHGSGWAGQDTRQRTAWHHRWGHGQEGTRTPGGRDPPRAGRQQDTQTDFLPDLTGVSGLSLALRQLLSPGRARSSSCYLGSAPGSIIGLGRNRRVLSRSTSIAPWQRRAWCRQHRGDAAPWAHPVPLAATPAQSNPPGASLGATGAGKDPGGEAIWCEEKPISCSKGCFAQRFTKCADATARPRWDINTSLVDVDPCPAATQTLPAMFSLKRKQGGTNSADTKSLTAEGLGLQGGPCAGPCTQHQPPPNLGQGLRPQAHGQRVGQTAVGTSAPALVQISSRSHTSLITLLSRHKSLCFHLSQFPKGLYPGAAPPAPRYLDTHPTCAAAIFGFF